MSQRIHAKVIVIDDDLVVVTSRSWSEANHLEIGVATNDPHTIDEVARIFDVLRPYMVDLDREALKAKRVLRCKCCTCEHPKRANPTLAGVTM